MRSLRQNCINLDTLVKTTVSYKTIVKLSQYSHFRQRYYNNWRNIVRQMYK